MARSEMEMVRLSLERETSYLACRSKLAEILEKVVKAELIRLGWPLEKTHDLSRLWECLEEFDSPLTEAALPICRALAQVYFTDRYPGFDLEDPDWPVFRAQVEQVVALLAEVQARLDAE